MSTDPLPPAAPTHATPLEYAKPTDGICCPRCGQFGAKPITYTWWGGFLGPRMINHTKCPGCGHVFNGKTGRSNRLAITLYVVVGIAVGVVGWIIVSPF